MVSASSGDYYQKTQQSMDIVPAQKLQTSTWKSKCVTELKHMGKDAAYGVLPLLILKTLPIPKPLFNQNWADGWAEIAINSLTAVPFLFRGVDNLYSSLSNSFSKSKAIIDEQHKGINSKNLVINSAMSMVKERQEELTGLLRPPENLEEYEEAIKSLFVHISKSEDHEELIGLLEKTREIDKEKQNVLFSLFSRLIRQNRKQQAEDTKRTLLEIVALLEKATGIKERKIASCILFVLNKAQEPEIKSLINDITMEMTIKKILASGNVNADETTLLQDALTLTNKKEAKKITPEAMLQIHHIFKEVTIKKILASGKITPDETELLKAALMILETKKDMEKLVSDDQAAKNLLKRGLKVAHIQSCALVMGWIATLASLSFTHLPSQWQFGTAGVIASVLNGLATRHILKF